jgi:hypothetical protein
MPYNRAALGGYYAQGDPFLGGLIKGAAKIGKGLLRSLPGPAGMIARTILPAGGGRVAPAPFPRPPAFGIRGAAAFAAPGVGVSLAGGAMLAPGGGAPPGGDGCPKGYRLNKSGYFLKSGQYVAPGTKCVRIRRMNPANSRALRRSLRREESFIRLARRSGLVALPKARRVRRAARKGK